MTRIKNQSAVVMGTVMAAAMTLSAGCPGPQEIAYENADVTAQTVDLGERVYGDPGPVPNGNATLQGIVKDYLTAAPVTGASVDTYGITPAITGTADGAGTFSLEIPVGSVFWARSYAAGYAYTYDYVSMATPQAVYDQNLYAVSTADLTALQTAFGVTPYNDCATVMVKAKNGGAVQANVEMKFGGKSYDGPYYLNLDSAADPAATYTSASGIAVFFNVCDDGLQSVTDGGTAYAYADGEYAAANQSMTLYAGGVTLTTLNVIQGVLEPEPDVNVIDYPTQVHTIFQKFACAGCHSAAGTAAATGLYFDGDPEAVWYELSQRPEVVNLQYPDQSKLLTKPLYEDPADHPNASFVDIYDADYIQVLQWIEQGAPYGVNPPVIVENPDFAVDVHPIFAARGCTACHSAADPDGGLDLEAAAYNVQQYVETYLVNLQYPQYSALLNNPYCGEDACVADADRAYETHPTRVFYTADDPDYVAIKNWLEYRVPQLDPIAPDYEYGVNVAMEDHTYRFAVMECTRCHGASAANAGVCDGDLCLDGTQYQIFQSIADQVNNAGVCVPGDPEGSYLYTKPNAYYPEVAHGGPKDVLDRLDNFAKYWGGWINEGANAPADVYPDWNEVKYVFGNVLQDGVTQGLNCQGCHNAADVTGGLSLEDDPNDPAVLYDAVRARVDNNYYLPDSSIVYKGTAGTTYLYVNDNHGGPKRQIAQYYAAYETLTRWIKGGAPGPQ